MGRLNSGCHGCDQIAGVALKGKLFAGGHFISVCYNAAERYDEMQKRIAWVCLTRIGAALHQSMLATPMR